MALATYLVFFLISHQLLLSLSEEEINPRCPSFRCGHLGYIGFPFSNRTHPECGLFVFDNCNEQEGPKIQLLKNESFFYVKEISQDNTLMLLDLPLSESFDNYSCKSFRNMTLPRSPFISFNIKSTQLLFKCPHTHYSIPKNYRLLCNFSTHYVIYDNWSNNSLPSPPAQCSVIQQQVTKFEKIVVFNNIFTGGFGFSLQVNVTRECYECHWRGGRCQSDSKGNFDCSEPGNAKDASWRRGQCKTDSNGNFNCSKTEPGNQHLTVKFKLQLGIGIGVSSLLIGVLIILALNCKKRLSSDNSTVFWKKKCKDYQNIEAFLRNYGSLAPKRYNYSDIKRMTNSFKHKLGEGGYGGVYKGKLLDGRNVAVKVLSGLKGNGEDFINEVASISRTSHVNIVSLFGYCFESRGRALIYEFVPNGSLEKFIYEKYSPNKQLKWEKLYQIAVGIARGLEYLHRGCSTRILHFDIKPHNILIDEDFCPKISDFGLAKICPRKESIISMTGARGTIGYIAPEVVCRNFGEVSHKSDVYSYGMMVLEMVGGRKNLNVGVDRTSEIYFPHWIYDRLEAAEELGLQGIENDDDNECARKMLTVSLWCIQTNPSSRPAMSRVVEMLEGSLDSLQFPPRPFLSFPRSEAADSLPSIVC